jgi:hypothetical protein
MAKHNEHRIPTAQAVRARLVGEWSNRHLVNFGPLLPRASDDVLRILGQDGSTGAMVLRRLVMLILNEHGGRMLDADTIISGAEPVTIKDQVSALVKAIMEDENGADLLPVNAEHDPENWDAIRSARLYIEKGI